MWSEQQKLVASDGAASDCFGCSVSVSGDTAVVGADADDTAGGADAGSAYVFVRSGTVWSEQQKLLASDGAADDCFGQSVSVSGDTVVVGASGDDTAGGVDAGSAYVFVRSGTVWSEQQKLLASDGAAGDGFGYSVSVSGDTVVVGALWDDTAGGGGRGLGVRVREVGDGVERSSRSSWPRTERRATPSAYSVSVSGDTVVVGAYWRRHGGRGGCGLGVRVREVGDGVERAAEAPGLGRSGERLFGSSVSVSGDTVVVGASDDTAGGADAGSAYVFVRSGTVWSRAAEAHGLGRSGERPLRLFRVGLRGHGGGRGVGTTRRAARMRARRTCS